MSRRFCGTFFAHLHLPVLPPAYAARFNNKSTASKGSFFPLTTSCEYIQEQRQFFRLRSTRGEHVTRLAVQLRSAVGIVPRDDGCLFGVWLIVARISVRRYLIRGDQAVAYLSWQARAILLELPRNAPGRSPYHGHLHVPATGAVTPQP